MTAAYTIIRVPKMLVNNPYLPGEKHYLSEARKYHGYPAPRLQPFLRHNYNIPPTSAYDYRAIPAPVSRDNKYRSPARTRRAHAATDVPKRLPRVGSASPNARRGSAENGGRKYGQRLLNNAERRPPRVSARSIQVYIRVRGCRVIWSISAAAAPTRGQSFAGRSKFARGRPNVRVRHVRGCIIHARFSGWREVSDPARPGKAAARVLTRRFFAAAAHF